MIHRLSSSSCFQFMLNTFAPFLLVNGMKQCDVVSVTDSKRHKMQVSRWYINRLYRFVHCCWQNIFFTLFANGSPAVCLLFHYYFFFGSLSQFMRIIFRKQVNKLCIFKSIDNYFYYEILKKKKWILIQRNLVHWTSKMPRTKKNLFNFNLFCFFRQL